MRRNVVYGPGFVNLDFSVIKDFKFGERFSLQLRGEFFNILNHPNFADPIMICPARPYLGAGPVTPDIFGLKSGDWLRRVPPCSGGRQNNLVRTAFEA